MDDFSDDGFDDLNVAVLQELETKALQAIQSQKQPQNSSNRGNEGIIEIDDDPDDAAVLRELARVPAQHALGGRLTAAAAPPPLPLPAYSQRSFVNVPLPSTTTSNTNSHSINNTTSHNLNHNRNISVNNGGNYNSRGPPAYYPRPSQQRPIPPPPASQSARPMAMPRPSQSVQARPMPRLTGPAMPVRPGVTAAAGGGRIGMAGAPAVGGGSINNATSNSSSDAASVAALQERIRMLETDLWTAQGKASVIESRYETAQREHEADVQRIQKQKDEELARLRQRAESAVAAHKSAVTELEFARQDLKEEVERGKKGRRTDRVESPSTPRKGAAGRSNWNVADGFDDVELMPSPSKNFSRRLKEAGASSAVADLQRTPTKGKRRRNITDSPTKPLETIAAEDEDVFNGSPGMPASTQGVTQGNTQNANDPPEDPPFVFIQEVLGHQSQPGEPTTIELFSRYSFPSNRKQTLAFLMLQRIPNLEGKQGTARLMLDFCQLLLGIWSQCLREEYHAPIRALVSLMSYILMRNPTGLTPHIMASLVPIAQETVYLVAAPAFNSPSGSLSNHPDYTVRQLACDIDTGATMALLQIVAFGCLSQTDAALLSATQNQASQALFPEIHKPTQTWFWSVVQFEFVLLMLSSKQAPDAFLSMLALLRTSALPDSIGPITNDPQRDAGVVASLIVDRISHHIEEPPKWASSSKYTEWDMRLAALGVLDCFAQSPFGRLSLAASDCALPRLVGVLFPAYGELRERDLTDEPLHPSDDFYSLSESQIRAYGIGGFALGQTLGLKHENSTLDGMSSDSLGGDTFVGERMLGQAPGSKDSDRNPTPLILLYVSTVVYLLHSILTDPYTAPVANMPAKLGETQGGMHGFYVLTMARLGFRIDPAFAVGLHEETHKLAMELFKLAATPEEEREYTEWTKKIHAETSTPRPQPHSDPFCDAIVGDLTVIKIEKGAVP